MTFDEYFSMGVSLFFFAVTSYFFRKALDKSLDKEEDHQSALMIVGWGYIIAYIALIAPILISLFL